MRLGDFDLRLSSDINTALLVTRDVGNLLVNCCFFWHFCPELREGMGRTERRRAVRIAACCMEL